MEFEKQLNNKKRYYFLYFGLASSILVFIVSLFSHSFSESRLEILAPMWNRELGMIEITQSIMILNILVGLIYIRKNLETISMNKKINTILIIGTIYIFLEENDYILHFYDRIFYGKQIYKTNFLKLRNVHNSHFTLTRINTGISILSFLLIFSLATYKVVKRKKFKISMKNQMFLLYILATALLPIIGILFGTIYKEDMRQIKSETFELALYTSWLLYLFFHLKTKAHNISIS